MTIRTMSATVIVQSPTRVKTKLVANVNPNLNLIPKSLLEFIMKKLCGMMLYKLQGSAKKVVKDPVRNVHAKRMRQEAAFYKGWLLPKFQEYCRMLKWEMPPIGAFQLTPAQLEKEMLKSGVRVEFDGLSADDEDVTEDEESAAISGLTNNTAFRNKNPITNLLREIEEKTQQRKEQNIAMARQRAAERLKPRPFSQEEVSRLEELAEARARRRSQPSQQGKSKRVLQQVPEMVVKDSTKQNLLPPLYSHSWLTRMFTIVVLVSTLMMVLFPELVLGMKSFFESPGGAGDFWDAFQLDMLTVGYLCLCALVHFALCDVSLVYALDAIELGTKTGNQFKKYYGDSIQIGVVLVSFGIVAISILKALSKVWLRAVVFYCMWLGRVSKNLLLTEITKLEEVSIADMVESSDSPLLLKIWTQGYEAVKFTSVQLQALGSFLLWCCAMLLLRTNRVGVVLEQVFQRFYVYFEAVSMLWSDYMEMVDNVYARAEQVTAWRMEAIATARTLFSYTSFFLMCVLFLFNALTRVTRSHVDEFSQTTATTEDLTVVEEEVASQAPPSIMVQSHPARLQEEATAASTATSTRRRFRLGRRKESNGSSYSMDGNMVR